MFMLTIPSAIGVVIWFVGAILIFNVAFKESIKQGLLTMLVPFYAIYYAITRWAETKIPSIVCLVGVVIFIGGRYLM